MRNFQLACRSELPFSFLGCRAALRATTEPGHLFHYSLKNFPHAIIVFQEEGGGEQGGGGGGILPE